MFLGLCDATLQPQPLYAAMCLFPLLPCGHVKPHELNVFPPVYSNSHVICPAAFCDHVRFALVWF